jgi:predicted MFS family arabinose efflux permease
LQLLNRDANAAVILAGIISLIVGVGVARFAFTSLLPFMLEDFMSISFAGVLASINYVGYLSGSIFAIFIKDMYSKVKYFRLGMVLCVVTTVILGTTTNELLWTVSRIIAGFGSAMALVVGSALVMSKLKLESKTKAMGIHFSGIGIAIVTTDLLARGVVMLNNSWQFAWIVLTLFGAVICCFSMYVLSIEKPKEKPAKGLRLDKSLFTPFVLLLIAAYFTEGIGFVVQATFMPDIINSLDGLQGYGSLTWTVVGLAGIPSCIIWMRMAHNYGSINIIILAMFLQVIGILIPTLTNNLYLNLLSAVFYGGTFVGLVALFMNLGGALAKNSPVILMGALTTAYGIGQVSAPLYSVSLIAYFKTYNMTLWVTAAIVFIGIVLLIVAKSFEKKEHKCSL